MIELAQHIEVLLLENDCVIVPGLGGFVAHYTPAMRVAEENVFLPPTRIIGFNPQLKMNDAVRWAVEWYRDFYEKGQVNTDADIRAYECLMELSKGK